MRLAADMLNREKSKILKLVAVSLIISVSGNGLHADNLGLMPSVTVLQMANSTNPGDRNANAAYFVGVSEALTMFIGKENESLGTGLFFCPPPGVVINVGMIETAFYQGRRGANPTNYAMFDILNGLGEMFPCN